MKSFLEEYVANCLAKKVNLQEQIFILPSRRAVNFFKKELVKQNPNHFFLPSLYSIEDFIAEIADVQIIETLPVVLEFYSVYTEVFPKDKQESFETVYNWSQTLIQDFNEIDRHLIDAEDFFGNLANVKEIDHWSKAENPTSMVKNYLEFWKILPKLYTLLTQNLIDKKQVYQGLAYKLAVQNFDQYLNENNKQLNFVGFNALNQSEQILFQKTLAEQKGDVIWDLDASLLTDKHHPASTFLRYYQKEWKFYQHKENTIQPSTDLFSFSKQIHTYAVPKKIGQAKMLGQILAELPKEEYSKTAVVLADEALLQPVLNAIPEQISQVNITMGLALKYTPLASFFESILQLHVHNQPDLFYKDVLQICGHPSFKMAFPKESKQLKNYFVENNILNISRTDFFQKFKTTDDAFKKALQLIFKATENNSNQLLQNCIDLCLLLKHYNQENALQLQYVFSFHKLFLQLKNLTQNTDYIQTNKAFFHVYKDILAHQTLDFQGSPFEGIQLMGMLETRVLDFENIIIASVNEGVLPSGKSENSYIPFDLKIAFNLPTYKDKDAIYAYHFFRLLQRAKNIHLLYNNDASGMEKAEQSRFLRHLEVFPQAKHQYQHHVVSASTKASLQSLQEIPKTPAILKKLKALLANGISPSALTTYIRNPLDFYKRYVLRIDETEEIEEEVSYRVYGNILHDTLQSLYEPFKEKQLKKADIEVFLANYETELHHQFSKHYNADAIKKGKNLIAFEIAKQQCERFLKQELKSIENHELQIISIEETRKIPLKVKNLDFPIFLKGKADRVDLLDGTFRIIDYKTGKVQQNELVVENEWDNFTEDYKYSKAFQVLFYGLLFKDEAKHKTMESGIFSFKNLNEGFLKFGKKTGKGHQKEHEISDEIMHDFEMHLSELIQEIVNPEIPFTEKEI